MADILPPAPVGAQFGSYNWTDWYKKVRDAINAAETIAWTAITGTPTTLAGYGITDAQSKLTNSAGLAAALSDETGTSLAVFNTSPTLVTPKVDIVTFEKASGNGIKVDTTTPTYPWADLIGKVLPKEIGVGSPTRVAYIGGAVGQYAFVANDVYDCEFHIPHDYVAGTDIYIHAHWSHNGTTISGNAVFDFYHTYAKGHNQQDFVAEKNLTITYATTDVATTPRYRHRIEEVIMSGASATATLMDRDDIEPDGLILLTIKLTTLPTIGGGGNLFIHTVDIHYQTTGIGTKQKDVATTGSFYT